jgi:CelD/BcsL family acetyltransferase involved in cellulose biosynthesis
MLVRLLGRRGMSSQTQPTFDSPCLEISGTWADYFSSRSTRTRKTLRNVRNTLHRCGESVVRQLRTWEEFQHYREEIYRVALSSWTGQIGNCLASPGNRDFFEDLTRAASRQGWLSVWVLVMEGKVIAFEYHLRAFGRQHGMRASFSPDYARLSPGTYLEMEILRAVFEEAGDVRFYDFGGCADPYKKKWTDHARRHYSLRFFNKRLCSRAVAFYEMQTVEKARGLRDWMRERAPISAM